MTSFRQTYIIVSLRKGMMIFAFMLAAINVAPGQDTINKPMLKGVVIGESVLAAASLTALASTWYSDYPASSFHFFNDNAEWLQMDKGGHLISSYNLARSGSALYRMAGVSRRKAAVISSITGMVYISSIEVMDGFSSQWGASAGDLIANTLGTAIFAGQEFLWGEQRLSLKVSWHNTPYPQYRPDVLGRTGPERFLKDYNGQTFWLSANIRSFLREGSRFPSWLNVAAGYGAEGMTGGFENPSEVNGIPIPAFSRVRQFYLSPDIDLSRIQTKSKLINLVFDILSVFKLPMPAVECGSDKTIRIHPFYF